MNENQCLDTLEIYTPHQLFLIGDYAYLRDNREALLSELASIYYFIQQMIQTITRIFKSK